ncbi:AraC family transcriptional regulator [Cytobacillus firmus]|uniref:helix-turn-helix domain-containing protein n=1 Tax=Cytobacillus firmus TaxID=1399 RepID=UPI001C8D90FC|nr:AraC family transcriptional regulator [Cytobacillus firmus]MBX9971571.1 AraC family transcriptional regulator [Cytobacillus firmus]
MNTIQKVSNNDLLFPFSFVYQDTKSPQRELADHWHDYFEIVYVYRGKGTFFIGDVLYDMQQGDVFLIPNNTIHRAMPDKEDPVTSTIIFFSPILIYSELADDSFSYRNLFEATKKNNNYKISLQSEEQKRMENQLLSIHQEAEERLPGFKHASLLTVHQIILDLYRTRMKNHENLMENSANSSVWITDILAYINDHLNEPLTLTKLAEKSLVSPSHFSRVFKESTGIGLINYLNTKRVIRAKELLLETIYTVSHIAEMCGFESMSHFHRVFKKYINMTPSTYRKENKNKAGS